LASHAYQRHRQLFCGICSLFQEMERANDVEEADVEIYLWHLREEHGVTLRPSEEVLTR